METSQLWEIGSDDVYMDEVKSELIKITGNCSCSKIVRYSWGSSGYDKTPYNSYYCL